MDEDQGRPAVVWFRRDLRLHDHPALTAAAAGDRPVVPLFVLDPALLAGRFASANRTWFLLGCLQALAGELARLGAPLIVRVGDPAVVVPEVARLAGATDVVVSRDHGPFGRARDARVADALDASGVRFHAKRGVTIHEPEELATASGTPFRVYSPFRRAWTALPRRSILPAPERLSGTDLEPGRVPTLADLDPGLGLGDAPTADPSALPVPGEAAARDRLASWLDRGVATYDRTRDRLDVAHGTSRLSADLHLGTLSPLEVVERALAAGEGAGPRRFVDELVWREFYAHVLFHEPGVRRAAFQPAFDSIAWSTDDVAITAWREGRTGYPVIDAAMRQLLATGWMPNRARMVVASFLTKDLLVDWRVGEAHFMRHLVDGDVASNNGGWQWTASTGTDPQPWFRIFNPVTQGRRADPDGDYVRRWLPELAALPTERIHAPWEDPDGATRAGVTLGQDYPMPIVDHAAARSRALAAYDVARRTS